MRSQAFSLMLAMPRPGGHISAFCEAETTTSTPHSSARISAPPNPLTLSQASTASVSPTIDPSAFRSVSAPVELSLWTVNTAS